MYLIKTPSLIQKFFPAYTWRVKTSKRNVFLTFDDGPIPEVTPWVLDLLDQYDAKATFFCVGDNVRKYPELLDRILDEGHSVGNHTQNHLNGWKTDTLEYVDNIHHCNTYVDSNLFRPPYGRITKQQAQQIGSQYEIVMWDVLTGDFDKRQSKETCLKKAIKHTTPGSVVVFHDSLKAKDTLEYVLPRYLESLKLEGYSFKALEMQCEGVAV